MKSKQTNTNENKCKCRLVYAGPLLYIRCVGQFSQTCLYNNNVTIHFSKPNSFDQAIVHRKKSNRYYVFIVDSIWFDFTRSRTYWNQKVETKMKFRRKYAFFFFLRKLIFWSCFCYGIFWALIIPYIWWFYSAISLSLTHIINPWLKNGWVTRNWEKSGKERKRI